MHASKHAVIGGGSWGTALASVLAQRSEVMLWARSEETVRGINEERRNPRYQTEFELPTTLRATTHLEQALTDASLITVVVPTHTMRAVMNEAAPFLRPGVPIVSASKGIENSTLSTMEDLLADILPRALRSELAFLSGPSFAREVLAKMATAVTVGARYQDVAEQVQRAYSTDYFRVYTTEDVTGVELGGALKNVVAIAAGTADGLGLGYNSLAALLTRGVAEITRLAVRLGANPLTLSGLAGMGDLVLTCTGKLSRNRHVGYEIGRGRKLSDILADMSQVAEGVRTTQSAHDLGQREGVEMPITDQVYEMLYNDKPAAAAMKTLMGRAPKREREP